MESRAPSWRSRRRKWEQVNGPKIRTYNYPPTAYRPARISSYNLPG
jgi:hypothetical protein